MGAASGYTKMNALRNDERAVNGVNGWFSLCLRATVLMCLWVVFVIAQSGDIVAPEDQKALEAVETALNALGGIDKIGDIKSLVVRWLWNKILLLCNTGSADFVIVRRFFKCPGFRYLSSKDPSGHSKRCRLRERTAYRLCQFRSMNRFAILAEEYLVDP